MMDLLRFLHYLSISAIITTIALFFCGIPICLDIKRRRIANEISGIPFLMGFLGCSFWLRYGYLKDDYTMMTVNVVGTIAFSLYCLFYLFYSNPVTSFLLKLSSVVTAILAMLVWTHFQPNMDILGLACMTFNIITFGAPLAGLGVVLKKRCCDTLPLPLCVANLLVSSQWLLYGNIVHDQYIMIPNGIGMLLAVFQLCLFVIFPMSSAQPSLLDKFIGCCRRHTADPEMGIPQSMKSSCTTLSLTSDSNLSKKNSNRQKSKQRSGSVLESPVIQIYRSRTNSVPEVIKHKFI